MNIHSNIYIICSYSVKHFKLFSWWFTCVYAVRTTLEWKM